MSGPQILPVELVGETCLYNVGNSTKIRIYIPELIEAAAASEMGFKAHVIDVG